MLKSSLPVDGLVNLNHFFSQGGGKIRVWSNSHAGRAGRPAGSLI